MTRLPGGGYQPSPTGRPRGAPPSGGGHVRPPATTEEQRDLDAQTIRVAHAYLGAHAVEQLTGSATHEQRAWWALNAAIRRADDAKV